MHLVGQSKLCPSLRNLKNLSKARGLKQLNFLSSDTDNILFNLSLNIKLTTMSFWLLLEVSIPGNTI